MHTYTLTRIMYCIQNVSVTAFSEVPGNVFVRYQTLAYCFNLRAALIGTLS